MVNDQLIRIHHMRLLSSDKMMTKQLEEQRAATAAAAVATAAGEPAGAAPDLQGCSSSTPASPSQPESLSCSAPETGLLGRRHSYIQQADDSASLGAKRRQVEVEESALSKSQSFLPAMRAYGAGGRKFKEENLEHSYNGGVELARANNDKSQPAQPASNKKKSSWRHLLSPSYKSRSDEFHKFFADEIPADERLIADYSCALHREILIQGRVYISINYIAFYSNLFSWITKLVVRLRDIVDIHKANTARIIPNAIQIVSQTGDKHVFASFIARDKSYLMFWRIWRNNLLMERITDQELRSLVHLSYGKDLGMSADEELKINSPDPKTPSNVRAATPETPQSSPDGNNNESETSHQEAPADERANKQTACDEATAERDCTCASQQSEPPESGRSRYNSVDHNTSAISDASQLTHQQAQVIGELSHRLREISPPESPPLEGRQGGLRRATTSPWIELTSSPTCGASSDPGASAQVESGAQLLATEQAEEQRQMNGRAGHFTNFFGRKSTADTSGPTATPREQSVELAASADGAESPALAERQESAGQVDKQHRSPERAHELNPAASDKQSAEREGDLYTTCDCESHQGSLVADEQFEIGVDTLFSLIFTNSKFMRAYMVQRGMTDAIVSKWRRSTNGAPSSNSSSLSRSLDDRASGGSGAGNARSRRNSINSNIYLARKPSVKSRQQRQLNYSMNINHVLAKQIQVEERQNICSVKPGVYVLQSHSINSGMPFSETFTVDLTYCMTRAGQASRSRMLVHGGVNFIKGKHSWRLAMMKSVIEKQSVQGINEFVVDLIGRIREYVAKKRQQLTASGAHEADLDQVSLFQQDQELYAHESQAGPGESAATPAAQAAPARHQRSQSHNKSQAAGAAAAARSSRSLARAKSKQKERKLRNMYKYYIQPARTAAAATNQSDEPPPSPGQPSAAELDAESDDSSESSLDAGLDDNDSMIMIMNTHETDAGSQMAQADRFAARAQSFSDLEWGQSMDDDDDDDDEEEEEEDEHKNCDSGERREYRARHERGSTSETSNVTINNGNIAANYRSRAAARARKQTNASGKRPLGGTGRAGDGCGPEKLAHGHSSSSAQQCATCGSPLAAGSRGLSLAHHRRRAAVFGKSAADCNGTTRSGSPLKGLARERNLVSLVLVLVGLLLCALLAAHLVVLRRLGGIEARLSADCAHRWPAANQSSARKTLL